MIVREDHRRSTNGQRLLDHFPWVDGGAVNRAAKECLKADNTMTVVQKQAAEKLVIQMSQA